MLLKKIGFTLRTTFYKYGTGWCEGGEKKIGMEWAGCLFLLCILGVENNECYGEGNATTHKVVIAIEIEIGSKGKAVSCGSIYHSGKPSGYCPILFYKLRLLSTFEVHSHYHLSSDFVPSFIGF
jgi:hypothetical protein